jgi:hypothetical protein
MIQREDRVLRQSRREALVVGGVWLIAMLYTVGYCAWRGYGRDPESLRFVAGFPDWIFWGIIVPWLSCVVVAGWLAYFFMTDEPLDEPVLDSGAQARQPGSGGA